MTWALPEWTVLAVLDEGPRHGFAIAALTASGGELGRVWQIPRPVVYRAINRLTGAGQAVATAVESGPGPQRTVYTITDTGRAAVGEWLWQPVEHVRDLRSHLLMKLALLHRRQINPAALIYAQRALLEPLVAALAARLDRQQGFEAVLASWRHANAEAALRFLSDIAEPG
jgi:DNA-binding PadR family transcriptional regulator